MLIVFVFLLFSTTIQGGQSKPGQTPKLSGEENGLNSTR